MELSVGAEIGGALRLVRPLGKGGMGIVWAARHLRLDVDVAVKLIRPDRAADNPGLLRRFEREAKTAARIAHPHVVRVMDYGVADGVPFIVMELLEGFSLAELLARGGRLSLGTAVVLVRQVADALASAHALGVVHRDIKPHNVFVTEGSRERPLFVKVLDFGVAKMLGDAQAPAGDTALTETGTVVGSPPYMSPEQLEGRADIDLRSDLWSLAIIVYEALTGERPFVGGSFVAVGAQVLAGRFTPLSELRPDLPPEIDAWFERALAVDPAERFVDAQAMADAFAELADPAELAVVPRLSLDAVEDALAHAATIEDEHAPAIEHEHEHQLVGDTTASHAAVARRPSRAGATRWRWRAAAIGTATLALGAGAWAVGSRPGQACPDGMTLVEGTTFSMGSPEHADTPTDETPAHDVRVAAFCIDTVEVTVRAYQTCADCALPRTVELEGLTPNGRDFDSQFCNGPERPDHPVNCVDQTHAETYCASVGKRLPTEEEWELSARGTQGHRYPWGDAPPNATLANVCGSECSTMLTDKRAAIGKGAWPALHAGDDAASATAPVGRFRASGPPFDLAGNVWEWTSSAYCPYGNKSCGDSRRVLRGGGWDTTQLTDIRAARRLPAAPRARGRSIGFRCARPL